jgi:predicted Zn-dependent protease
MQSSTRKGLSLEESRALCNKVLSYSKADHARVNVDSGVHLFTRSAINRVTTAGATEDVNVRIISVFGKRVASTVTNRLDDASLERTVRDCEALAKLSPEDPEYMPELNEQKYSEVNAYYASTGDLTTEARAQAASFAVKSADAAKLMASGFIDVSAGSNAVATSNRLFGYHSGTGVASTLTMRTLDGDSSGWAGDEGADWTTIESERIGADAVRKCQDWRGKTSLDPGKYEVILEPTAAGMLMLRMMNVFDARQAEEGRSFLSKPGGGTRLNEKLFDERVTIISDPMEKNAETSTFTGGGLPVGRETWVEKGVLKTLSYSRFWADRKGVAPKPPGLNFVMSGGMSSGIASIDDMIRETRRGVLITRFWYVRPLNPRIASFTGLTRDGTFLIENGKVSRPVTNFRFNQSLSEMLANVQMLGSPTRVCASESSTVGPPIVVPAMKVKDFFLSSVSDAI